MAQGSAHDRVHPPELQKADQQRAELQQRFGTDLAVHLAQHQLKNFQRRSANAANAKARHIKPQDNVRAVVVK